MSDLIEIVTWSKRRHWADPSSARRNIDGSVKATCGPYTWGWAQGEGGRWMRQFTPEQIAAMPFCKHCARKADR